MHQPRTYRHWVRDDDLVSFRVTVQETDLYIRATRNLEAEASQAVLECRSSLEGYIREHPDFLTSLGPIAVARDAPDVVSDMARAAYAAGVGPMAAVAGAVAEHVGNRLVGLSSEVVVENGGDIFIASTKTRLVGVYAGDSSFTGKIALRVQAEETPMGICTSSGTVGHSLSFGTADAVIAVSRCTSLADAAATAICNTVKCEEDVPRSIELATKIDGLRGIVVIKGDKLGVWGEIEIASVGAEEAATVESPRLG
ncbi:MAG: UPF0280 family protein [Chloroflexota bacterium]|nr:UPF0280 family protein [Chloroflexota bacterium]